MDSLFNSTTDHVRKLDEKRTAKAMARLEKLESFVSHYTKSFIGYPCNKAFNLDPLFQFWQSTCLSKSPLNEVGNPLGESSYDLNTREFEREVLEMFSSMFHIPFPECWGYITSGGTQGNEQGLYMGRERLKAYGAPILYVSKEAHYSIHSLGRILDMEMRIIPSQPNGEMDYAALEATIDATRPALFSLSIGTTFKGAIDRIEVVDGIVRRLKVPAVHYHADGALFGGYLAFAEDPYAPKIDFARFPYHSVAVSGHKFFGAPIPMGVFLCRKELLESLQGEYIEYIDTQNVTIPCSRSSLNTLILWWTMMTTAKETFVEETQMILENAAYLHRRLREIGYRSWLNLYSNTVYFECPSSEVCKKWCLAKMTCPHYGSLAHVVVMQHVTREVIDRFIEELNVKK